MEENKLTTIIGNIAWVRGFLQRYESNLTECTERLDEVLHELMKELEDGQ